MSKTFKTIEDLITEPSFLNWYHRKDKNSVEYWEAYKNEDASQGKLVEEATKFLKHIKFAEPLLDNKHVQTAWEKVELSTFQQNENEARGGKLIKRSGKLIKITPRRLWWYAAAVIILISGIAVTTYLINDIKVATHYGEITVKNLPDGSVVILNANSKIRTSTFNLDKTREVWLDGEAFFKVHKTANKDRFIVHTGRLDIEVTGTQFNVVNRNTRLNVFLKEGSITLRKYDGKEVKMKPGDYFELNENNLEKKTVKDQTVLAWKDRKLVFDNTSLREVADKLKDTYGVDVVLDNDIANKTVNGIMPNDDLDGLIQAMEIAYNLKITYSKNTITILQR